MGRIKRTILTLGLIVFVALSLVSCGDPGEDDDLRTLQSIEVTPGNPSIDLFASQQFTATGTYDNGTTRDMTIAVTWSTSDASVATVSAQGLITSVSAGTTTVTATDADTGISGTTGLSSGCAATVSNDGPVSQRSRANVTLDLSCSGLATGYGCRTGSARICLSGPEDFETDAGPFTLTDAALAECGDNGVPEDECHEDNGYPDLLQFNSNTTGTALAGGIDAMGFSALQVHFTAAYHIQTSAVENIRVYACCGDGCTPAFVAADSNASAGGTDEWSERGPFGLERETFDNCPTTTVGFSLTTTSIIKFAHMDDYALSGIGKYAIPLADNLDGTYTGGFAACVPDTVEVSCTWSTVHGTFQADNTTDVQFD